MGKKCIPGLICIENMTLFLIFIAIILIIYFYYTLIIKSNNINSNENKNKTEPQVVVINQQQPSVDSVVLNGPPLRYADGIPPLIINGGLPGVPINIETRGLNLNYSQIGILTRTNIAHKMDPGSAILPLIGRQYIAGRDKWQYYTLSNSGSINTKLPIRVNGKNCSGEYGCDSLMNGDIVYVEGYDSTFRVTIYDSAQFNYIPYL